MRCLQRRQRHRQPKQPNAGIATGHLDPTTAAWAVSDVASTSSDQEMIEVVAGRPEQEAQRGPAGDMKKIGGRCPATASVSASWCRIARSCWATILVTWLRHQAEDHPSPNHSASAVSGY